MMPVHIFLLLIAFATPPMTIDLMEHTFDTMAQCKEFVVAHPEVIEKAMAEARPMIRVPDGTPIDVGYGCRGKEKIGADT